MKYIDFSQAQPTPRTMLSLIYINETPERNKFTIKNGVMKIGRNPTADLYLEDEVISYDHATITFENAVYVLRDFSSNGCFVNGEPVTNRVLRQDDLIRFGQYLFLVNLAPSAIPTGKAIPVAMPKKKVVPQVRVREAQYEPVLSS